MRAPPPLCFALALALGALGGCGDPPPPTPQPTPAAPRPPPADDLEAAMRAREPTDAYALSPVGTPFRATLEAEERQSFAEVLRDGFCYKLLAQSDDGVEDLDLFLYDGNGVLVQTDAREGPSPVLGSDRPICPEEPGVHRTEVRMVRGRGRVLVQWYMNQSL